MPEPCYLCYDIKGIQQFIFSVPKLKYVVGASILIDRFDRKAKQTQNVSGIEAVFTGGGKGTFWAPSDEAAKEWRDELVRRAHDEGLDLRIGISADLSEAARRADDLYPFVPDSLEGEPCFASRLWPVSETDGIRRRGIDGLIHPLIDKRAQAAGDRSNRPLDAEILNDIHDQLPEELRNKTLEFLTVVRADEEMDADEKRLAKAADRSLGNRNRWAILSMDGNDMGCQFRAFEAKKPSDDEKKRWMAVMSEKLRECTRSAFEKGLVTAIEEWWNDANKDGVNSFVDDDTQTIVLPFRPLILGGDDILCLCHPSYAMSMARTIITAFQKKSSDAATQAEKEIGPLWPGTGGCLTISAGIAYTGVTLPLFLSIPYAESLLGSAKKKFRDRKKEGEPTPSAIDWESITETMVDTPAERRRRDLTFYDKDIDREIVLTMRPYRVVADEEKTSEITLERIEKLKQELNGRPRSVLTELMTVLTLPWGERVGRLTAMAVQNPDIMKWLDDGISHSDALGLCWEEKNGKRYNWFLDALLLLEEEKRMERETVQ